MDSKKEKNVSPWWFVAVAALLGLFVLIERTPDRTLSYVDALRWPAVVLLAGWYFRSEIARKLRELTKASTPFGSGEFADPRDQTGHNDQADEAPAAIARDNPELAQEELEDFPLDPENEADDLREKISVLEISADMGRIGTSIFNTQVLLLRALAEAERGFTVNGMQGFYASLGESYAALKTLALEAFLGFLHDAGLITFNELGNYVITDKGRAFLRFLEGRYFAPRSI